MTRLIFFSSLKPQAVEQIAGPEVGVRNAFPFLGGRFVFVQQPMMMPMLMFFQVMPMLVESLDVVMMGPLRFTDR